MVWQVVAPTEPLKAGGRDLQATEKYPGGLGLAVPKLNYDAEPSRINPTNSISS